MAYLSQYVVDGMPLSVQFCGLLEFDKRTNRITIPHARYGGKEGAERACACGETSTDYLGIDDETCSFFKNGWFKKAKEMMTTSSLVL